MRTVPTLAAGALLIAACGSDDVLQPPTETIAPETTVTDPPTTPDPSPSSTSDVEQSSTTEPTSPDSSTTSRQTSAPSTPDQLANLAIDDLMTRIGVERSEIGVRSVDEVTWRDGSIGCPDPDFAYTQALVAGIRVVLDHDGFAYHYHQGGDSDLFYCPTPAAPLETSALE